MAASKSMNERDLIAYLASEKRQALGMLSGDLSSQRSKAMDYYLGDMDTDLPAPEGHSKAVSTDVQDAVEGLMPDLMEIFAGTDQVCAFNAMGPEDEEAAAQETEAVNHTFYNKNPGFVILYSFIKDALLQKVGVVKHWWDETDCSERESYEGIPDPAFQMLLADLQMEEQTYDAQAKTDPRLKKRALVEHTERTETATDANGQPVQMTVHDYTIEYTYKKCQVRVMPLPPEDFLIASDARSIREARYVAHKERKSQSDLIGMGLDAAKVKDLPTFSAVDSQEEQARQTVTDESETAKEVEHDPARLIEIVEHWVKVDYDGDGLTEWRCVITDTDCAVVLRNEPSESGPEEIFSAMSPIIMAHQFTGRSIADLVLDIQRIKTVMLRMLLDNTYLNAHPIAELPDTALGETTIDDLLNRRPGCIVQTKQPGQLLFHSPPPILDKIIPAMEFIEGMKENRTGVTRYNQGIDGDSLNKTASGVNRIMGAAERRMKLVARVLAETGIKDMMLGIHALMLKHQRWAEMMKLRGHWVPVNPRDWKRRADMTISVGLGTGSKDQMLVHLQTMLAVQVQALQMQGGAAGPLVTMRNIFNTLKKMVENSGLKSVELYFTEPPENFQPPPKPDPKVEQAKAMLEIKQQESQAKLAQSAQESQQDMALKDQQAKQDQFLKWMEAQIDAQVKLRMAEIHASLKAREQDYRMESGGYAPQPMGGA